MQGPNIVNDTQPVLRGFFEGFFIDIQVCMIYPTSITSNTGASLMDHFKFYGSATIGTKGQVVIPAEAREELAMRDGDKVIITKAPHHNGILIIKADVLENHLSEIQEKLKNHKEV